MLEYEIKARRILIDARVPQMLTSYSNPSAIRLIFAAIAILL